MILVEPGLVDRQVFRKDNKSRAGVKKVITALLSRPTEWDTRECAYAHMRKRVAWQNWDPRVLTLFVVCPCSALLAVRILSSSFVQEHGLRPIAPGSSRVTTKLNKAHHTEPFTEHSAMFQSIEQIERI